MKELSCFSPLRLTCFHSDWRVWALKVWPTVSPTLPSTALTLPVHPVVRGCVFFEELHPFHSGTSRRETALAWDELSRMKSPFKEIPRASAPSSSGQLCCKKTFLDVFFPSLLVKHVAVVNTLSLYPTVTKRNCWKASLAQKSYSCFFLMWRFILRPLCSLWRKQLARKKSE